MYEAYRPPHNTAQTSIDAHRGNEKDGYYTGKQKEIVTVLRGKKEGLTGLEIADAISERYNKRCPHSSITQAIKDLLANNTIVQAGERKNDTGRTAKVYVLVVEIKRTLF